MAIKYQYNKTSLTELGRQLKIRTRALPTLKNKESAVRAEVKHAKERAEALAEEYQKTLTSYDYMASLWNEFQPDLITIEGVDLEVVKVAGVKTPSLKEVKYSVKPFDVFAKPMWYSEGVEILKKLAVIGIESQILLEKARILDYQRKKTTQKVNLYEKVQIPGFQEAMRKIKRFMEDEENISKASQKIVKGRHAAEEEEEQA